MSFNPGDVVYFKEARRGLSKKFQVGRFKGHGFGVLLGLVPDFLNREPPVDHIFRLLGSVGFLAFDDILEFLGKEQQEICVKKFQEKYFRGLPAGSSEVGTKELPTGAEIVPFKPEGPEQVEIEKELQGEHDATTQRGEIPKDNLEEHRDREESPSGNAD